jgi:3-oxoadipate enol-lactonase
VSVAVRDGVRIAYEVRGDGAPLVFVHGLAYDRHGWGPLPSLLEQDFRVVLIDNRGVGESDAPPGPYTVAELAADVACVLDTEDIGRAHLFGVSLGGYVAQEFALTYPQRVDRLVLASTAPGGPRSHPMRARGVEAFRRFPTLGREEGLRLLVENSLGDGAVQARPELVEEIYAYRLAHAPTLEAWQAQASAGATFDAYDRVSQIAASTLVLSGDDDNVVDPRNADLLGELIPNARVEHVAGGGHLLVWQEGERVAALVREFLR